MGMTFALKRGFAVFLALLFNATLHAQGGTPQISSLQSGLFQPTHGAAITAGTSTPAAAIQLFINGSFSPANNTETVNWTENGITTPLQLLSASSMVLMANVPQSLYTSPGVATITVSESPGGVGGGSVGRRAMALAPAAISNAATFTVNPAMAAVTLPSGAIGVPYSQPFFTGGTPPFDSAAQTKPPGLNITAAGNVLAGTPTQTGTFPFLPSVADVWGNSLAPAESVTIGTGLVITTTALPAGTVLVSYTAGVSVTGGQTPYTFSASGLPANLTINTLSGVISGTPIGSGTFPVVVRVSDAAGQNASANFSLLINPAPPPALQILTTSLPPGAVGQSYAATLAATGGTGNYSFSITSGSPPPGVQLFQSGTLFGTPTAAGTYTFTAQVTDSSQHVASQGFSIVISPGQITITGTPPASVAFNAAISVKFGATGGTPPYTLTLSGTPPTGTSFANGTLSGTATAPGTYSFTIAASDSQNPPATAQQSFTITVGPAPLTITPTLPAGQAGTPYTGSFSATGGVGPYTWSGTTSGGLSLSSLGVVTGTPALPGTITIAVTVTDSNGATANGTFTVSIAPPTLAITTLSLPAGTASTLYSASLGATGGTPPYTWSATGLPAGVTVSSLGAIAGTPGTAGTFGVNATVTDAAGTTASAALSMVVNPAPLLITSTTIPPVTIGGTLSAQFVATGGTPPYTWSATGLPSGVNLASDGTLSGAPTTPGTYPITVTVTDANATKQTATATLNLVAALPPAPPSNLNGLPANGNPASQLSAPVTFGAAYPVDVTVNLTMTFAPVSGPDDPNVQFANGGRLATLTVNAGSTTSGSNVSVQTGTVAGVITITEHLIAGGTDITPSPAPTRTIVIAAAAPTISSVTAAVNGSGFTVTITGFDPTRSITQATFTFTPTTGSNLQTTTLTVSAQSLFSAWYQNPASAQFGSQFSFTMPFNVAGSVSGIASVAVTLTNSTGTSASVSATL
jgi:hypothetical protein